VTFSGAPTAVGAEDAAELTEDSRSTPKPPDEKPES
jgi:hypothetical protein